MMKGLLEIADQDYPRAEETLHLARDLQSNVPVSINFGSARLLLAYLYHCWGQPEVALRELAPVLAHHQQRETPGLLLMAGPALITPFQLPSPTTMSAPSLQASSCRCWPKSAWM